MTNALTDELIKSVTPTIYKHLIKIGANSEDAKDIVQDTLYKAVLYIDSIDPNRVPAWLFKVAINRYYDLCRKHNRRVEMSIAETVVLRDEETPETVFLNKTRKHGITQILEGLSVTQKHLLVLRYEQDLSYKEISNLLGVPVAKVATNLHRAKQKFKQAYLEVQSIE